MIATQFNIRDVRADDSERLWRWANDPIVRASAFSTAPIPRETHERWFAQKLSDPDTVLLVAETPAGQPVGQIRFDLRSGGEEADVDVTVDPGMRGRGLGARLITDGVAILGLRRPACAVRALVRPTNRASRTAFERAGFVFAGEITHEGVPVCVFLAPPVEVRP